MNAKHNDQNIIPRSLRLKREYRFVERVASVSLVVALVCFVSAVGSFYSLKAMFDMSKSDPSEIQLMLGRLLNVVPLTIAMVGVVCVVVSLLLLFAQYMDVALASALWKRKQRKGGRS